MRYENKTVLCYFLIETYNLNLNLKIKQHRCLKLYNVLLIKVLVKTLLRNMKPALNRGIVSVEHYCSRSMSVRTKPVVLYNNIVTYNIVQLVLIKISTK